MAAVVVLEIKVRAPSAKKGKQLLSVTLESGAQPEPDRTTDSVVCVPELQSRPQQELDPVFFVGRSISDTEKVTLLTRKWTPPTGFEFLVVNGRRYNVQWEKEYCWLRYSQSGDAAFCAYCVLFSSTRHGKGCMSMEVFQSSGFRDWKNAMGNKRGMLPCHHKSEAHVEAA